MCAARSARAPQRDRPLPRGGSRAPDRSRRSRSTGSPAAHRRRRRRRRPRGSARAPRRAGAGRGRPDRFALVATTAPSRSTISAAGPASSGTRTPIVSGRLAESQPKRPAGLGTTSVNGPGSSARTTAAGPPVSSGMHSSSTVDAREQDCRRLDRVPSLEPVQIRGRLLAAGRADEAVDGVGREHGQLPVAERPDDALDVRSPPSALDDAVEPAQVRRHAHVDEAELPNRAAVAAASARPRPRARELHPARARRRLRVQPPRPRRRRSGPRAAPSRAPRAASDGRSTGVDVRRIRDDQVPRARRADPSKRSWRASSTVSPVRATFSAASASASAELSMPVTTAPGCSSAIASAIAPEPVPTSSTRGRSSACDEREGALDEDLRLGPRDQRPPVDGQRQPAEPPLAEHVLERLAPGAARHEPACGVELGRSQRRDRAPCRARSARGPVAFASRRSASSRGVSDPFAARCSVERRSTSETVSETVSAPGSSLAPTPALASCAGGLEREPPILGLDRLRELLEIAVEDLVEPVHGQLDPVIGEPVLGEVVGADLLGPLAGADLQLPRRRELRPAASRAPARTAARGARASPSAGSGAATSRPASRRRRRSAGG